MYAYILPGLANQYLLSIGQICDAGYQVLFQVNKSAVFDAEKKVIMVGWRVPQSLLG